MKQVRSRLMKHSTVNRHFGAQYFFHRCDALAWIVVGILLCILPKQHTTAQEVKIWEFDPYSVEIWCTFDSSVEISALRKSAFLDQLQGELERTFRAAWRTDFVEFPPQLAARVARNFDGFTVDDLTANELVLVVSVDNKQSKNLRTFDAAMEALSEIAVTSEAKATLAAEAERFGVADDSPVTSMLGKLVDQYEGIDEIKSQLTSAALPAAIIPRSEVAGLMNVVRPLLIPLPWQSEAIFSRRDKLFFLMLHADGDDILVSARELDCPMRYFGPAFTSKVEHWSQAARVSAMALSRAFAPIARVEDATSQSAELRLRAGGLILNANNPASVLVGDVMQPIVRRDDRNGVPTLLEPLSWTFAAITDSDGVEMNANVYTYSGGPGLQGRKNRRTQRVLLKVRPVTDQTAVEVLVRGEKGKPQSGCFVYRRDLLTQEFEYLGRTDWRGRFTIPVPEVYGKFIPNAARTSRQSAKREQEAAAMDNTQTADPGAAESLPMDGQETAEIESDMETAEVNSSSAMDEPIAGDEAAEIQSSADELATNAADRQALEAKFNTLQDPEALPLRFPLTQIYIKSGDTVLAKLAMVPGLKAIETAELPDDARRLEAEAFVRGFQGEILDLIGLRNLLAARVKLFCEARTSDPKERESNLLAAESNVDQLRKLPNFNELADRLDSIQRDMMDESRGNISFSAKNRIDRMCQTTRDMLQKYLQDDLLQTSEGILKAARDRQGGSPATNSTQVANASGTNCEFEEFTFVLPNRYRAEASPASGDDRMVIGVWRSMKNQDEPEAALLANFVRDAKLFAETEANPRQSLVNFSAGLTDNMGMKILTRGETEKMSSNGVNFTYFDWSGQLGGKEIGGATYAILRGERVLFLTHIVFEGDIGEALVEMRRQLSTFRAK